MLISVNEDDFKDKVKIRFNNITEGINKFENKILESNNSYDFEQSMIGFFEESSKIKWSRKFIC